MLPFYGTADVAYIPNGSIVGVSKIPRLVNRFARRLQIQERLARQVGEAFVNTEFPPLGVAVHVVGKHLCMMARGVRQTGAEMESNFLTGMFRTDPAARAEFFARIH
jgi:GTP cyclohydrolase I